MRFFKGTNGQKGYIKERRPVIPPGWEPTIDLARQLNQAIADAKKWETY